jgi:hypothetical protein
MVRLSRQGLFLATGATGRLLATAGDRPSPCDGRRPVISPRRQAAGHLFATAATGYLLAAGGGRRPAAGERPHGGDLFSSRLPSEHGYTSLRQWAARHARQAASACRSVKNLEMAQGLGLKMTRAASM